MQVANDQIIGSRKEQQDYFAIPEIPKGLLTIVADGMGGYKGGAVASSEAVKQFIRTLRENFNENNVPLMLEQALRAANKRIAEIKKQNSQLDSMGTTFLATLFINDRIYWLSVGDSILFRWRNGSLERLNEIHSMAERVDKEAALGIISTREAAENPQRHAITSGLTGKEIPLIDVPKIGLDIIQGDRFMLASDGLLTLTVNEIEKTIQATNQPNQLTQKLLTAVSQKNKPNQDNCTVISIYADKELTGVFAPLGLPSRRKLNKMANLLLIPLALVVLALAYFFLPIDPLGIKSSKPTEATDSMNADPSLVIAPNDSTAKADSIKAAEEKAPESSGKPVPEKKRQDGGKTKPTAKLKPVQSSSATAPGNNAPVQAGPAPVENTEPTAPEPPSGNPNEPGATPDGGTPTPARNPQSTVPANQNESGTTPQGGASQTGTSETGQQGTAPDTKNESGTTPQGGANQTGTSETVQQGTAPDKQNASGGASQSGTSGTGEQETSKDEKDKAKTTQQGDGNTGSSEGSQQNAAPENQNESGATPQKSTESGQNPPPTL